MYIVYTDNTFTLLNKEYFSKKGDEIIGFHNPELATRFGTKEEAKAFQSEISLKTKITTIDEECELFKKTDWVYRKFKCVNKTLNIPYKKGDDKVSVLNWWMRYNKSNDRETTYDVYSTYPKLYSLFSHLWNISRYTSKNYVNKYITAEIYTNQEGTYNDFLEELNLVINDVTYLSEDGYKILPIFDKDLSEYGSRYLYFKDVNDCYIQEGYRTNMNKSTLSECFKKMTKEFYYE